MVLSHSPRNHNLFWLDLLQERKSTNLLQNIWWLVKQADGHSNYKNCLNRTSEQVRNDIYKDDRVKRFVDLDPGNKLKVERILNEMSHSLPSIHLTYKLKMAGIPFIKCINKIYSSIYVNGNILDSPYTSNNIFEKQVELPTFKNSYLHISKESRFIILPTHRSYMDFLLITYILFHCELPLPIVAAGDNFKSLGTTLSNFLKGTGAFLVRRNAQNKHDIEASDYYDVLRAYVHSLVYGGENPLEFFMEGTRTRTGQVLRPKTGLISMVVDMFLSGQIDDLQIYPVAINYQRPIEEQLYVKEILTQIGMKKPKESFRNLMKAFGTITTRQYGKVYVKFCPPIKISKFFSEWTNSMQSESDHKIYTEKFDKASPAVLHDFTNYLAARVSLVQASNTVMMPFNLIACSILFHVFFNNPNTDNQQTREGQDFVIFTEDCQEDFNATPNQHTFCKKIKVSRIIDDFSHLEDLLIYTQPDFIHGWEKQLDILKEFCLDRDNIVRVSSDRNYIECNKNLITFQTLLYYSNQITQILLPVAIETLKSSNVSDISHLNYRDIREMLSREFLMEETLLEKEERDIQELCAKKKMSRTGKSILVSQIGYYVRSYSIFLEYLQNTIEPIDLANNPFLIQSQLAGHYMSKDMLKNMIDLVIKTGIAIKNVDEYLIVEDRAKLSELHKQYLVALQAASIFVRPVNSPTGSSAGQEVNQ